MHAHILQSKTMKCCGRQERHKKLVCLLEKGPKRSKNRTHQIDERGP